MDEFVGRSAYGWMAECCHLWWGYGLVACEGDGACMFCMVLSHPEGHIHANTIQDVTGNDNLDL